MAKLTKDTIGVGFIGTGDISVLHASAVAKCPGAKLVGVWNRSPDRAKERAAAFGCKSYPTPAELVNDPAIDAVFVLTNLETHLEYTKLALDAGKHVLVEKPVGVSVAEIAEMKHLADARGLVCMPGHNYIYEAGMRRTHDLVAGGDLGRIVSAYVMYNIHHPEEVAKRYPGVVRQILTHHSYILLYLVGAPVELCAMKATLSYQEYPEEDIAMVQMRLASGALAHFCASFAADDHAADPWTVMVKVIGTAGSTRYSYRDHVEIKPGLVHSQTYTAYQGSVTNEVRHFLLDCLRFGEAPLSTLADAITAQKMIEAAEASVRDRSVVRLATISPTPGVPMRTLFAFVLAASPAVAQAPKVAAIKPGAKVAIVGDSITEQKLYSRYVAGYLAACQPQLDVRVAQFGWSGERAGGFLARMDNDLMPFQPDVVTLCYGMNDGEYRAYAADIGKRYETPLTAIVGKLKAAGATVVVGSPGCVDQYFFRRKPDEKTSAFAATYNDNLAHLRDIAKSAAAAADMPFADVHDAMREAMLKAQAKLGDKYHVCGSDGFHPAPNGQLAMAYAFLKATDLSGDLGTITIDMTGESKAENGHKVVEAKEGVVKVESRRYPFAHPGSATDPNGTRSIAPFLPFDAEFNRLTLVVKNAPADKLDVTWGDETKAFTRDELAKGVNLATAFANHPLAAAFRKVDAAVTDQQNFQTFMIKQVITNHRQLLAAAKGDAELAAALKAVVARTWAIDAAKAAAVKAAVVPVTHTITVKAAG